MELPELVSWPMIAAQLVLLIVIVGAAHLQTQLEHYVGAFCESVDALLERFRDHTREGICESLRQFGVPATLAPRGGPEEAALGRVALDLVWIPEGPIRWVNVRSGGEDYEYAVDYGVPDPRLRAGLTSGLKIECVTNAGIWSFQTWLYVDPTKLEWRGNDRGLGLLHKLNRDASLTRPLLRLNERVTISAHEGLGFWVIAVPNGRTGVNLPSLDQWHCYQAIAQHLLATPLAR